MIAAVRIRSDTDARQKVARTLDNLGLRRNNQCVVHEDSESIRGMLNVVKDYVAYGEIDEETVEKLEERRGEILENGDTVNLSPPSKGYRSTKKNHGQGGSLGERPDMNELISRMV